MKKLFIGFLFALFPLAAMAQNQSAMLADFRRIVGEPDSTGSVTGAIARTWLNLGLREFANYGAFMRDTTYVAAAGSDTLRLPTDFLYPRGVFKTLYDKKSFRIPLSDTGLKTIQRMDTIVLSTTRPDTILAADIVKIRYCYKKAATDKAIRPLVQVPAESLAIVGRALLTRSLPPQFLSERLDTIIPSTTQPINILRTDVFEIRSAYRKDLTSGKLIPLVRTPAESLYRVATTPADYYYFSGQPSPRIVFGQKKGFADTVYAEAVVASDFFTFISHPYPRLIMGKIPTTADSCFCQTEAVLPNYSFDDTGKVATTGRGFLRFYPPIVRADTILLNYFTTMDSLPSADNDTGSWQRLELNVRGALLNYMAEQYYDRKSMPDLANKHGAKWREIMTRWAIMRGFPVVQANK